MSQSDEDINRVKQACISLGDHFDSVQIFVSRHEEGEEHGTVNINFGSGNWFTRRGQIMEWVIKQDETARLEIRENYE